MKFFLGPEVAIPALLLALALLLVGFRKQAGAVALFALAIVFFPFYRELLTNFFPYWVAIIITIVTVIAIARFLLSLLVGEAIDNAIGNLLADAIKYILKFPAWLARKLRLWGAFLSLGRKIIDVLKWAGGGFKRVGANSYEKVREFKTNRAKLETSSDTDNESN